jgi:type III restriction enzyme
VSGYEVPQPILNSPFDPPAEHWLIVEGEQPQCVQGRRKAVYFYRDPKAKNAQGQVGGVPVELTLVNLIRDRVDDWREKGYPGVTRTTLELLQSWNRDGRDRRLFFAQREAAETIIFLTEARADFLQGITIPRDEPSDSEKAEGYSGFLRYACKMATGSGKTTVMGMLAAWSILNKLNDRSDARFSDVVLIVCPNVTIRDRLRELDPAGGEASLYRTRDLVPAPMMTLLTQGKVIVTNWHVFELQSVSAGGVGSKVNKAGVAQQTREWIVIGGKTTTARGSRYMTQTALDAAIASGEIDVLDRQVDDAGNLKKVLIRSEKRVESDTALVNRIIGREAGGKQNILVMNDEAHHAYRIKRETAEEDELSLLEDEFEDEEEAEEFAKEATVWIDGLDRIQKLRGINVCIDLSATPYFLGRVGQDTNRPFPWVVSDFGLIDAIESGLVKIPQLAVRDTTGAAIPGYFNIWHWILPKLTPAERGGKRANPKPEAILKWAHTPIAMLGGLWEATIDQWEEGGEARPPVFILVCKNTAIAKVVHEWLAEGKDPAGIPPVKVDAFRNRDGVFSTIRVDSKKVHETDTGAAKSDESRWMRFTLDTVGKGEWPLDRQSGPIYPDGFEDLARKLERPLHPPGRDVRCIVSVGMLTEGWDCSTVTHIVGLRPFMSQLLCEQVVGRGLRRASYEVDENGLLQEEVAKVFGVPFEIIPFKANPQAAPVPQKPRRHVHAVPVKAAFEIKFPRVERYTTAIRNRVTADWASIPKVVIDPGQIPPEVEVKALSVNNVGRLSLTGPGRADELTLREFRNKRRLQELTFDLARSLTRDYLAQAHCDVPAHVLFPQLQPICDRYVREYVKVHRPADRKDLFCSPYYGWIVERLIEAIRPDTSQGEAPEVPKYETSRGPGSTADVDLWTTKEVREVNRSHLNYVVADTRRWEEQAAYYLDTKDKVDAFVKNQGLGFTIPYFHNGQAHDYIPDFIVRLKTTPPIHLILETKGYDPLDEVKRAAAERWVAAVNADGTYGRWAYAITRRSTEINQIIENICSNV